MENDELLQFQKVLVCCCRLFTKSCLTLCDPMSCSMWSFPVLNHLPELAQTHVRWVSDAIQLSHPLPPPSPILNLCLGFTPLIYILSWWFPEPLVSPREIELVGWSQDDLLPGSCCSVCRNAEPLTGATGLEIMSGLPTSCECEVPVIHSGILSSK